MKPLPLGAGGEFDRIRSIIAELGVDGAGIGDDTATIPTGSGELVVSTDASIELVHFRRDWIHPEEIGWRATAAALSDLAAAAARPVGAVVALSLPPGTSDSELSALARGIAGAVRSAGCKVLGGDLTSGDRLALTVTVFGRSPQPLSRRGARVGDGVWVTGVLGGSRAALVEWQAGRVPPTAARMAFARPQSRHRAAHWLAEQGATAMMDISDGLAGDAPHLAAASGVAIEIDLARVPVHPSVHAIAARVGEPATRFAAIGGEDYELLLTLPDMFTAGAVADAATGVGLTRVGTVVAGDGVRFLEAGVPIVIEGFRHST
jgi:thiamine-monophosphate kinase